MAQSKLELLNQQIKGLVAMRGQLARLLKDWDTKLAQARKGIPARLLETVPKDLKTGISPFVLTTRDRKIAVVAVLAIGLSLQATPKDTQEPSSQHHSGMMRRGDEAMGFSHEKTTHHFRLFKDGGAIEVNANDPKDTATRDQIRMHLTHGAHMFSSGDFNAPMFIHGKTPPGVPTMKELHDQIQYVLQETDSGARVRIETANAQVLEAVHSFLRFQITEHQAGDSMELTESAIPTTT